MDLQSFFTSFTSLAHTMPLELFVFVGILLDELFSPIPATVILAIAGSIAKVQGQSWFFLFVLALLGALAKTIGMWVYYLIGKKAEDMFIPKYGRMIGITQGQIDKWSKKMRGGWRDMLLLFVIRAVPFIPTIPVSFVYGALEANLRYFIIMSFLGTIVRNMIFLYVSYIGAMHMNAEFMERITQIWFGVFVIGFSIWYYWNRKKEA